MQLTRLISTASAAVLLAGLAAHPAAAQATATAQTEAAAQAATGKASTDQPANTQPQGAAQAVKEGAAPAAQAQAQAAATPVGAQLKPVAAAGDLVETLKASGQFSTFIKAVDATNLTSVLKTYKNLTVFAPTDAAFAALPAGELDKLMADKTALQKLLTHHIINAPVDSAKIAGAKGPVPSVAADNILLDGSEEGVLKADGATIVQADVRASNGIVHVVDRVLVAGQGDASASTGAGADSAAAAPEGSGSQQ